MKILNQTYINPVNKILDLNLMEQKKKFKVIIIKIDIVESIIVIKAGRYEAEVITGANINIENGFIIPPVRKSKKPNCNVSKSK